MFIYIIQIITPNHTRRDTNYESKSRATYLGKASLHIHRHSVPHNINKLKDLQKPSA